MGQGRQAKILSPKQGAAALRRFEATRQPLRDQVMFLLSVKAGLRAKEMAELTWAMVTDGSGELGTAMALPDRASKGTDGGRTIPLHPKLRVALAALYAWRREPADVEPADAVVYSERGWRLSAATVQRWFDRHYRALGFVGCSSHSGRRTFVTRGARKAVEAGGSLRDVQQLAGHASLATTQRYIEGDTDAKRKLVSLIEGATGRWTGGWCPITMPLHARPDQTGERQQVGGKKKVRP